MVAFATNRLPQGSDAGAAPLTLARQAQRALETWILSEAAMALPIHELEVEQERRAREVQRLMLQAHLEARGQGDVGPALLLRQGAVERRLGHREGHRRGLLTIFGEVQVDRLGYRSRRGASLHPLDEDLALPARSASQEVQRRLVKAAVQGPFDEAVERLEASTGVHLSKRTAEAVVREAAEDFDAFYASRQLPTATETGPIVVGAVDGKGIPMRKVEPSARTVRRTKGQKANKKRMATVGAVFTQHARVRTPGDVVESLFREGPRPEGRPPPEPRARPEHKRVFASLKRSKDEVIAEVAAEMRRRDPCGSKRHVVVTDGERALQRRVGQQMPGVTLVLDLLHVLEYLWKAAYVFHAEGTAAATDWVRQRALWILQGRGGQVVKGLRQSITKRGLRGSRRKTLQSVAGYFQRNRLRMRYHQYLAAGLPIASGAVEGACKNLIKDRMERSGMRWTEDGAEAMVRLRAAYLSGDFEAYWALHVRKEQERLYPQNRWRPLPASA
jgi:hypothetical protein